MNCTVGPEASFWTRSARPAFSDTVFLKERKASFRVFPVFGSGISVWTD